MQKKAFRVLVVDDEPDLVEILSERFEEEGFDAHCASNGVEALAKIRLNPVDLPFDLVVTDIRMPGLSGIELLKEIRKMAADKPLVFLISGFADFSIEDAFAEGANAFISKPYSLDDVVSQAALKLNAPKETWTRKHPRAAVLESVTLESTSVEYALKGNVFNIGYGGMFVHCDVSKIPKVSNNVIEFNLNFKEGSLTQISITGIVRWTRKVATSTEPTGFGLEFVDLSEPSLNFVLKTIEKLSSPATIPRK